MPLLPSVIAVLEQLAEATWDRLDLSERFDCPTSEATITNNNLFELKRCNLPGLSIYKARGPDEPNKGFDWEWFIGSTAAKFSRYSIQAKKLHLKKNRYQTFRHKVGTRYQIDILENFACAQQTIPLYCFYSASSSAIEQQH